MTFAIGAEEIHKARLARKVPEGMLIVSLIGPLQESNKVIIAHPGMSYDWRFMKGLKVCVFALPRTPYQKTVIEIGMHQPGWLGLWDAEDMKGADCIVHIKPDRIDAASGRRPVAENFDAMYWAWTDFENKQFRGEHEAYQR
jgi:hypothetical protein